MNNAVEAKPPNDESNWQSIDIYLFANGQQYSPPRKYHLTSDELDSWDSTLSNLGKSLYGVTHPNIILYTTDGHKIGGPLELMDGMVYVAVETPDSFIDAGYDKYLLRASRSWEKRQAKRGSPVDVTNRPKHGCHHDQPCCWCPEREVECERSVLVTTEIPTLRAPDETLVDSVREILVLLSLLPVAGYHCHATSYPKSCCRHSTTDFVQASQRFHSRNNQAWRYFREIISSTSRRRHADCSARSGAIHTLLGRTCHHGPWISSYNPRTGEYIIEPAERCISADCRTRLDENCPRFAEQDFALGECGRCRPNENRCCPGEYGPIPEYGRTLAEQGIMPVNYGRIPVNENIPEVENRHTPFESKWTTGERGRLPSEHKVSENVQIPEKQGPNLGEYENRVVDQGLTPVEYSRSLGTPAELLRSPVDEMRLPTENSSPEEQIRGLGESGYPIREQGKTPGEYRRSASLLDNGYPPITQNGTQGEHVSRPDYGQVRPLSESDPHPSGEKYRTPGEYERIPVDQERTPSNSKRTPGEHDLGPSEYVHSSLDQEHTPIDPKGLPGEHIRTSLEFEPPSIEQRRAQSDNDRPKGEQIRPLGEFDRAPVDQARASFEYGRLPVEHVPSLVPSKQTSIPGESRRSSGGQSHAPGEHIHPPESCSSGEQGGIPSEYGRSPIGQNHDSGVGPGGQGRISGERGHKPLAQGRTTGEYKRPGSVGRPGGQGRNSGEYSHAPVDSAGNNQGEYGRPQGQQGRDGSRTSGEQGRIPGENGRPVGENGRTPGNYVRKPGERGRLSSERARTSAENRRNPGDYRPTSGQKRLSNEQRRTSGDRGNTLGSHGLTSYGQGRIPGEYGNIYGDLKPRMDDQPLTLSDYFPSPEVSDTTVTDIPEALPVDTIASSNDPRLIEHQDQSGEQGKRVNSIEGRMAETGSRVSDKGDKTGDQQGRLSDHDGRFSERKDSMGKAITHGGIGNGSSLVEHPVKETEYVSIPGGQEAVAELGEEQKDYRDNSGGRRGELEGRAGNLPTRLAVNGARLSGGGTNVPPGFLIETQQHNRKNNITSPAQNAPVAENKHRWSGPTHSSMRRPSPCPVSPAPHRRSEDKKLVRTSKEESRKAIPKPLSRPLNGSAAPNVAGKKNAPKNPSKRSVPQPVPLPASNVNQSVIQETSLPKIVSNHKSSTTDGTAVDNIIGDKDIIVVSTNIFRNPESEITSIRLDSGGNPLNPVNEEVQTCTEHVAEVINEDRHGGTTTTSRNVTKTSSKLKMSRPASGPRLNSVAGDATPEENYIAIINKGDVVNLKVNIEVRSVPSSNHKPAKKSRSLTNIPRAEIGSQISLDEDLVVPSKSLQSILNSEFRGTGFEGRPKVVVVQCACCGTRVQNPQRNDATPLENKKYFVLVPSSQNVNNVHKCGSNPALNLTSDHRDHPQVKKNSSCLPAKKTYSNMSLEAVSIRESTSPFPRRDVGLFMATTNYQDSFGCPAPKPRVSITEEHIPRCSSLKRTSTSQISVTQGGGCCPAAGNNNLRTCQNFSDSFTQTQWCSVLLEARLHEDGHYSFHLPSLQVLRCYAFN